MAAIKAPNNLPELVRAAFNKARTNGDLMYFPTQVAILSPSSIPFQLRYSPSLASKPKPAPSSRASSKPYDPFSDPPPALLIADFPPKHYLVLNKFAVVPEHFILATRAFESQTDLLTPDTLAATYACIEAYRPGPEEEEEDELFAFYNSGPHSGASQPHRHVQLLPVAKMREGIVGEWKVAAGDRDELGKLPFETFAEEIGPGLEGGELHALYLRLYRLACDAVGKFRGSTVEVPEEMTGEARISYNLAMTRHTLVVCPRTSEGGQISLDGNEVGTLSLNGTVLSGSALVKNEAEWNALRHKPETLLEVLKTIGIPK